jgi:hypothetical protein
MIPVSRARSASVARHFMRCRPAVLLTSPRDIPNSSLLVVLDHEIGKHPLPFQSPTHSFAKTPGWHQERSFNSSTLDSSTSSATTPLSATLTAKHRVLAEISRNRPSATPLDATLTESASVTPLGATLTKKGGREWSAMLTSHGRSMVALSAKIAEVKPRSSLE